ncbi:MAG: hypothetical protein N3I35_07500 [Clostridia bacterium]|nr:hypothetical protein [Clostridia bacterium]
MVCKDCKSFKPDKNFEAGRELSPEIKSIKGKCDVNNNECLAGDKCGCGGFAKK